MHKAVKPVENVVLYADTGLDKGTGHLYQMVALACDLGKSTRVRMITGDATAADLVSRNYPELTVDPGGHGALFSALERQPSTTVIDKLDIGCRFAGEVRRRVQGKLVFFNNLTKANELADVVVIPAVGSSLRELVSANGSTGTKYLYGPKYCILRREFLEYGALGKPSPTEVSSVLVTLGGSDPSGTTPLVLQELLAGKRIPAVAVVLGAYSSHWGALVRMGQGTRACHVSVVRNTSNMAELMYASDLVITSPGLSVFEALSVGTPVITIPHSAAQEKEYAGCITVVKRENLKSLNAIIAGGRFTHPDDEEVRTMHIGQERDRVIREVLS